MGGCTHLEAMDVEPNLFQPFWASNRHILTFYGSLSVDQTSRPLSISLTWDDDDSQCSKERIQLLRECDPLLRVLLHHLARLNDGKLHMRANNIYLADNATLDTHMRLKVISTSVHAL